MIKYVDRISITRLLPHEEVDMGKVTNMMREFSKHRPEYPIVIDHMSKLILDGHHRSAAMWQTGKKYIPAILVDVYDENIILKWRKSGYEDTKTDIIINAYKGILYPTKTTKFMYKIDDKLIPIGEFMNDLYKMFV